MGYNGEAVTAKLSSLNETQESIVTVAQWIMFHRRKANVTAEVWLQRLQESNTSKRLNLIYLANEVVQQSRARNKDDFLLAFEPIITDAVALAYTNASQEVQGKLQRVVEVWRQRNIFAPGIQDMTEKRLDEIDKQRGGAQANGTGSGGTKRLGGTLFGGSAGNIPSELEAAAKLQAGVSKADISVRPAVDKANDEYAKMTDPDAAVPTAPVHAARLSALMKQLASAEGAVEASINARKGLLTELERLVESHRGKLETDETTFKKIASRKENVEMKKKEVEDNIMRGLSAPTSPEDNTGELPEDVGTNGNTGNRPGSREVERPEAEGFTPPPPDVESFTPPPLETETVDPAPFFSNDTSVEDAAARTGYTSTTGAEALREQPPNFDEPAPAFEPPPALIPRDSAAAAANEFLNNLQVAGHIRQASSESPAQGSSGDPRLKRRKLSHKNAGGDVDEEILGVGGVDEEGVSALLGQ